VSFSRTGTCPGAPLPGRSGGRAAPLRGLGLLRLRPREDGKIAGDGEGALELRAAVLPVAADHDPVVPDLGEPLLALDELDETGRIGELVVVELHGRALGAAVELGDAGAFAEGLDPDDGHQRLDLLRQR